MTENIDPKLYIALLSIATKLKKQGSKVEEELRFQIEACIDLIATEINLKLYKNT